MIRNWLRSWLGVNDTLALDRVAMLFSRVAELEKELAKQELTHASEITELRERLETPVRRKPSGRPFAVLAKIAEMGAQKQNAG